MKRPQTIPEPQENIRVEIMEQQPQILTVESAVERARLCEMEN